MEAFWVALVKPFMALAMLMAAWPFKRAVELWMPDSWPLKQFLLKRRGDAMQAWFEEADRRVGRFFVRMFRALIPRR